jgi:hypothetical protein
MRMTPTSWRARRTTAALAAATLLAASPQAVRAERPAAAVEDHAGHHAGDAAEAPLKIERVVRAPDHFVGNVAFDRTSGRLWLVAFGPPANTRGSSALYELDREDGRVLGKATLPFRGEFASAAYLDGSLYQPIPYESTLYKVRAATPAALGTIESAVRLPGIEDLRRPLDEDVYRFPFVAWSAAAVLPDGALVLYAADLGELITIHRDTAAVLARVRTTKGLTGITVVPGPGGHDLLLGTFDPVESAFRQETRRFMYRASHGILPLETVRQEGNYGTPGQKTVTWVLLDPGTGEVLAATPMESTRFGAASVALIRREELPGTRYGRLHAFTVGEEGLLEVQWTPR